MKSRELSALVLLAAIWGVSFLLIRVARPALSPLALVNTWMLIAGAALLLYVIHMPRQRPALRRSWKAYLVLGATQLGTTA